VKWKFGASFAAFVVKKKKPTSEMLALCSIV
jgi:hypothetical protein